VTAVNGGRASIPGTADAHAKVANLGASLASVELTGASIYHEMVERPES
jgi:hypothetical protein